MTYIRVLSWNALGGNSNNLANAITAMNIDITVLQETPNLALNAFYVPLNALVGYTLHGPIRENASRHTPAGQLISPDPNVIRSYAVVTRNHTIPPATVAAALVDYTADAAYAPVPNLAFNAAARGMSLRPPLRVTFTHSGNPCIIYNWHSPIGHQNTVGLNLFDGCQTLATDIATNSLVLIGADLNVDPLPAAYFPNFDAIADGYDHVLAINTAPVAVPVMDIRTLPGTGLANIAALNGLYAYPHWAVPARVRY
jgi:hypothetical protein